jgi:glyoxylase-like metal-dependent hydrolase (beta-lactamase superfamily II)
MRKTGFRLTDISYFLVTHFHIDHAGAVQELKELGPAFILMICQQNTIDDMERMAENKWPYKKLVRQDNLLLVPEASRSFLSGMGIAGEILPLPAHTEDSVALVLDSGDAFTGDLLAEKLLTDTSQKEKQAWDKLREMGVRNIYPSHGQNYSLLYEHS